MSLEPEHLKHLTVAEGYSELGMYLEANDELEQIDPGIRHVPEVLAVRVRIYHALKKWELLQVVATELAEFDPDEPQWTVSLAFATRRTESLEAAKEILAKAATRNPKVGIFHFNLACYECQLGNLEAAKKHLSNAITLEKHWRQEALTDPDLEPLWQSLSP